mmetsp:Transcript_122460/g.381233  ORF Transcript_122460/g.381233 Transcript_122460/m.381233 type:complete len:410 (+) Transcript_122460:68-1297(+)
MACRVAGRWQRRPAVRAWIVPFQLCLVAAGSGASATAVALPSTAWNFAYGSNLDRGTRERRGLGPRAIVPTCVKGWELAFSLAGVPYVEPAFAAVRPAPARDVEVHGVCLELDREGWLRLLESEGVLGPSSSMMARLRGDSLADILAKAQARRVGPGGAAGYRLERVEVRPYPAAEHPSSASVPQFAYALTDVPPLASPHDEGGASGGGAGAEVLSLPSVRYWRLLRNGARRHGLDADYRSFLWSFPRFQPSLLGPVALLAGAPALLALSRPRLRAAGLGAFLLDASGRAAGAPAGAAGRGRGLRCGPSARSVSPAGGCPGVWARPATPAGCQAAAAAAASLRRTARILSIQPRAAAATGVARGGRDGRPDCSQSLPLARGGTRASVVSSHNYAVDDAGMACYTVTAAH